MRAVLRHAEPAGDLVREDDADDEGERRIRHLGPENRADQRTPVLGFLVQEVEADEAEVGAAPQQGDRHSHRRHEDLDPAVVARRDVARVQRQQDDREEARDEAADAVDERISR